MAVFEQAHFVQQMTSIALLGGAMHPRAGALAHVGQPALHPRGQAVMGGKGPPYAVLVVQQGGQQAVQHVAGMGGIYPQQGGRSLGAEAVAVEVVPIALLLRRCGDDGNTPSPNCAAKRARRWA